MFTWAALLEILIFAVGIYVVLTFLRQTRGSGVVRGLSLVLLAVIVTFSVLIKWLELERLGVVFSSLRDIAVVGLIIVFQPEIRRAMVHLGESPIFSRFARREVKTLQRLLRAVARLSRDRTGALIVLEREASLASYAEQGVQIDAELNSYLIEAIFHRGGALHDGAMVVRDERIIAAACMLPLTQNPGLDRRLGTRHRAAVGISEETDALAVVVSEETGKISTALNGRLRHGLSMEDLERAIEQAFGREEDS